MPLPPVPFSTEIDDLIVTTNSISIDLTNFIHPISSPAEDDSPHTHMKAVCTNEEHTQMDVTIHMVICGKVPTDQRLLMTGKFSVSSDYPLTTGYVGVRLSKYSYDLIQEYIDNKPLQDKKGNPFQLPEFNYSEKHFANLAMG